MEEKNACCRQAAMAGLVHTAGTFLIKGGTREEDRYEIRVASTTQLAVRMVYSYFKSLGVEGRLITSREPRLRHRLIYEIRVPGEAAALQALNEMGVLSDRFTLRTGIAPWLIKKSCCRRAFLRGCVIGAGSVNAPLKETHFEIVTPHEELCEDLLEMLIVMQFHPGSSVRRGNHVVYLKGRDEVAGILAAAGAQAAALQIQEQSVLREVRSRANRVANCDSANVRRTGAAASRQLEAIALLQECGRLEHMSGALRDMADLRVANPYANLNELVEAGGQGLTRSAVNHRLRRLVEAAEKAGEAGPRDRIQRR